jgi:RNA polymerase subunit RPABC4/transcription elongation factor Spt4
MPTEIQIPSVLITILQLILAFGGAFFLALWLSLIVWTFRDARLRSRDIFAILLATLMVTIFGPLGVILYFLLRPPTTLAELYERSLEEEALLQDLEERPQCPTCSRLVDDIWIVCPDCHSSLKKPCANCGKSLNLNWNICPFCGVHVTAAEADFSGHDHYSGQVYYNEPQREPEPAIITPPPASETRPMQTAPTDAEQAEPYQEEVRPAFRGDQTRPHIPEAGTA